MVSRILSLLLVLLASLNIKYYCSAFFQSHTRISFNNVKALFLIFYKYSSSIFWNYVTNFTMSAVKKH